MIVLNRTAGSGPPSQYDDTLAEGPKGPRAENVQAHNDHSRI